MSIEKGWNNNQWVVYLCYLGRRVRVKMMQVEKRNRGQEEWYKESREKRDCIVTVTEEQ